MKKIFYILTILLCSCKNENKDKLELIGTWQTDSLSMNGITIKGDLLNSDKFFWTINFKIDSTYSVYQGKNKNFISGGRWTKESDGIKTVDFKNEKMNCVFLTENSIKLIYNNDVKNIHSIMYFTKNEKKLKDFHSEISSKSEKSLISGIATFPSDGIPDYINVYAQDISSKEIFEHKIFDRKQGYFEIYLDKGKYFIFSAENSTNFNNPNQNKIVEVYQNQNISNIQAQDLSINNFTVQQNLNENYETNFTLRLLEDLTDINDINIKDIENQLKSFKNDWQFKNKYSENGEYSFGRENEVIIIRLKGLKNTLFYTFLDKSIFTEINEQLQTYVDLKLLKSENSTDYNKKFYETPYHKIMLAEVKEDNKVFGYNIRMSLK